jgi:hypothetical protein
MRTSSVVMLLWLAACGGKPDKSSAADSLSERQRDSMLAGSRIPGARGVGAAMRYADTTSAHIRAVDSVAQ